MSDKHINQSSDVSTLMSFFEQFKREYDFYARSAEECAKILKEKLADVGIRCIVSSRAKNPEKLLKKTQERNKTKKYKNAHDIRNDIADLAGVRIALYFPSDREKVADIIAETHNIQFKKNFPEGAKKPNKRFDGYHADHYRVTIKGQGIDTRYCEVPIEIQVASLLMHAWSEVEHDLVYKPDTGTLSKEEHAILDELNGLVIAGEIALERLRDVIELRVSNSSNLGFANKYDLASYIYNKIGTKKHGVKNISNLDAIWNILFNTPEENFPQIKDALDGAIISASTEEKRIYPYLIEQLAQKGIIEIPSGISFNEHNYADYNNSEKNLSRSSQLIEIIISMVKEITEAIGFKIASDQYSGISMQRLYESFTRNGLTLSISQIEYLKYVIDNYTTDGFYKIGYIELEDTIENLLPIYNQIKKFLSDPLKSRNHRNR